MSTTNAPARTTSVIPGAYIPNSPVIGGSVTDTVGFFGATGTTPVTLPADATDLASAVTLVNAIKVALKGYGLCL